jgi:uncharacterized protein YjbI with pentapeptide repeats
MSEYDGIRLSAIPRPTTSEPEAWTAYWKEQGQPWRREPEIDAGREKYLKELMIASPFYPGPFNGIDLSRADLEWLLATTPNEKRLNLQGANLRNKPLQSLNLRGALLDDTHLEGADFSLASLDGAVLARSHMEKANLNNASLMRVNLFEAHLEGASLAMVHLEGSLLHEVRLEGAFLYKTHLEKALLVKAHLEGASLNEAHLEGTDLHMSHLEGCNLNGAFFDSATNLRNVFLTDKIFGPVSLAGAHWSDADLSIVDWTQVTVLGDEHQACQRKNKDGETKDNPFRIYEYKTAVRAYRQLAVTLRNQGLNEDASRFAYRAQLMQRKVFWFQRKFAQYLGSLFLDLLAGYGYRWWRSFVAYLLVIITFGIAYFIIGHKFGPVLSPLGSLVFSMTSFHGRGFFPGGITLDDPLTVVAAFEAFIGLLIEVTFIATLTQRLFGK